MSKTCPRSLPKGAFFVSDSKEKPKIPPPDDFSKTTPNIPIDDEDSDWANTSSGTPSESPADDWGKTVINYNVAEEHDDAPSYGEEHHPSPDTPKQPEWGMTQPNVNLNDDFEDAGQQEDENYGATTPYFKLPEADQKKYQNLPPTPAEKALEEESRNKGGIPVWFWAGTAILVMLFFSFVVFLGVWYVFLADNGFEVTIIGAKPGSKFRVDGASWGIESEKGNYRLVGLKAGKRWVEIVNPASECTPNPVSVQGEDGERVEKLVSCRDKAVATLDCKNTRDIQEREKCANDALDALGDPPDIDALLAALNMLIINFESGKHDIPAARMNILRKAASKIQLLPESVVIEVGGHTDNIGSDASNQALSERRADAVKKALVSFGVRDASLAVRGYGSSVPAADNRTEQGRFDNRRINYKAVQR